MLMLFDRVQLVVDDMFQIIIDVATFWSSYLDFVDALGQPPHEKHMRERPLAAWQADPCPTANVTTYYTKTSSSARVRVSFL